jgi:hypothetical protein
MQHSIFYNEKITLSGYLFYFLVLVLILNYNISRCSFLVLFCIGTEKGCTTPELIFRSIPLSVLAFYSHPISLYNGSMITLCGEQLIPCG